MFLYIAVLILQQKKKDKMKRSYIYEKNTPPGDKKGTFF